MKHGDISNVSSPQVIVTCDVITKLVEEETGKLFLKKKEYKVGSLEVLAANTLWRISTSYGLSLELAGFEDMNWTEELLQSVFDKLDRRVVNPFNYFQIYESVDELVGLLPYRPNLKGVIDIPERVARYGSYGVELSNL